MTDELDLRDHIRTVPDFPKPGIMFRDVTTLFSSPAAMRKMIQGFQEQWADLPFDYVAGIDARGFIIGGALALQLGVGFVPVRKEGKLPAETISEDYELEYGTATVELHRDAVPARARVSSGVSSSVSAEGEVRSGAHGVLEPDGRGARPLMRL